MYLDLSFTLLNSLSTQANNTRITPSFMHFESVILPFNAISTYIQTYPKCLEKKLLLQENSCEKKKIKFRCSSL